jgi:hypothetical protein
VVKAEHNIAGVFKTRLSKVRDSRMPLNRSSKQLASLLFPPWRSRDAAQSCFVYATGYRQYLPVWFDKSVAEMESEHTAET